MTTLTEGPVLGIPSLDNARLFEPGKLVVLSGLTGVGKTSLALQSVAHSDAGTPILFDSRELSNEAVIQQILQASSKSEDDELVRLEQSRFVLSSAKSMTGLEAAITEGQSRLAIVDGFSNFTPSNLIENMTRLRSLAQELNSTILLIMQASRAGVNDYAQPARFHLAEYADLLLALARPHSSLTCSLSLKATLAVHRDPTEEANEIVELLFNPKTRSFQAWDAAEAVTLRS